MSEDATITRRETFFACVAPTAERVSLVGTFNGWDPAATPMLRDPSGSWTLLLDLPAGAYQYKYVVDGQWCCEPGCGEGPEGARKCVPNSFGTLNSTLAVGE